MNGQRPAGLAKPDRRLDAIFPLSVVLSLLALLLPAHPARRYRPGCHSRACVRRVDRRYAKQHPFTGYVVAGPVSTFGWPTDGSSGGLTADGGSTRRPCIAIRDDRTLGHWFLVTVLGHTARLLHCDYGPSASTGRAIDITGMGAQALGLSPYSFPTGAWGVARELR